MSSGPEAQTMGFSSHEPEANYRPIAQMAIVSLVFGILSLLAFASPLFWFLPVLGLAIGITTSFQLEKARKEYAGQLMTKVAVFLSLSSLVAAPTQYALTKYILTKEARQVLGDQYLDLLLSNRSKEAFVLTLPPPNRAGRESNPDELIVRAGNGYREFLNSAPWYTMGGKLQDAQVAYIGVLDYNFAEGYYVVVLQYEITVGEKVYDTVVVAKGGAAPSGEWQGRQWYAERVNITEKFE